MAPGSTLPDPYDGLVDAMVGSPLPVHDCMGMSLFVDGQPWGALTLDALHPGTFDSNARRDLQHYSLLIEAAVRITRLEQENRSLRHQQEQLVNERSQLLAKNEQARTRVEAMIARLKSLEHNA